MHAHRRVFVIVQSGAAHARVLERKAEWFDQVQLRAGVGAQADHIARVGRNFGFDENDVEHGGRPGNTGGELIGIGKGCHLATRRTTQ
ncbi:hypothetical protein ACFSUI_05060 [Ralstonia solanacearum]